MRPVICLLVAVFCTLVAGEEPLKPGFNDKLRAGGMSWNAFVPKAQDAQPAVRLPVVFALGGDVRTFSAWAERRGVYVVSFPDLRDGVDAESAGLVIEAVLKAAEQRLRLHPYLRYYLGQHNSSAEWACVTAKQQGDRAAGVMFHGALPKPVAGELPRHVAFAYISYLGSNWYGPAQVEQALARIKAGNRAVRWDQVESGEQAPRTIATLTESHLDWLLFTTCVSHPKLDGKDREAGLERLRLAAEDLPKVADPAVRMRDALTFLDIPAVTQGKGATSLRQLWLASVLEVAGKTEAAMQRFGILDAAAGHAQYKSADPKQRKEIDDQLKALRKDPQIKAAVESAAALDEARKAEAKLGEKPAKLPLQKCIEQYAAICTKWPDAPGARTAAEARDRLQELFDKTYPAKKK
jgi:hypothetical protein